jgi:hypothetical protein
VGALKRGEGPYVSWKGLPRFVGRAPTFRGGGLPRFVGGLPRFVGGLPRFVEGSMFDFGLQFCRAERGRGFPRPVGRASCFVEGAPTFRGLAGSMFRGRGPHVSWKGFPNVWCYGKYSS